MKIKDALAVKGYGGYFWDDQEAIKKGAKKNGFVYFGSPETPGFYAIRQPSEAICLMLLLDDGQVALGDCSSVSYSARSGREPVLYSDTYQPIVQEKVLPVLKGKQITHFRQMAEEIKSVEIEGSQLHPGIRYGITQAFLDAVAKSQKRTMAEVIAEEYETQVAKKPVRVFCQTGDDWYIAVDKIILRRIDVFPHGDVKNQEKFAKLAGYIEWIRNRIKELAGNEYHPRLHFDLYASLGIKCNNDIPQMLKHIKIWERLASPYKLTIEQPFDMKSRNETMELMVKLIKAKRAAGIDVLIAADEWCNTLEDLKTFVDNKAAEMIHIKSPDVGGVDDIVEAILYCKKNGVCAYLGGSCAETDVSARVACHIALATEPFQMLLKPGEGVDEGYQAVMNEMNRTLTLLRLR